MKRSPPSYTVFVGGLGRGGMGAHTIDLVRALASAGYSVTLVAFENNYFSQPLANTTVRVIDCRLFESRFPWKTFQRWSAAIKPLAGPRAILCMGAGASLAILLALRCWFGRLYTLDHGMVKLASGGSPSRRLIRRVRNWLASHIVYRAIAVSEAVRQSIINAFEFDVLQVRTCHNWVDVSYFKPDSTARKKVRKDLGLKEDCFVIGYVGRLVPEKRVDIILKGFAAFSKVSHRSTKLVIVGTGWMKDDLYDLAQDLGIQHYTHFVGWVDNTVPWHNAFDVEILASLSEGFCLSVLEAISCGKIVLINQIDSIKEYINNAENGFVVPLEQSYDFVQWLTRIAELNNIQCERMQNLARQTAIERFNVHDRLSELLEALEAPLAAEYIRKYGA